MSNTYRVNFMVGVIVPQNNIKQSMKKRISILRLFCKLRV